MKTIIKLFLPLLFIPVGLSAQTIDPSENSENKKSSYKKRVLESIEVDLLSSFYTQDGENAAVSGGIGTEDLQDVTATINISIPITADDVITIEAGTSSYTSASSSNVNPFDGRQEANPFLASTGASRRDTWSSGSLGYSHSSDNRNQVFGGQLSYATEYDYSSIGLGGSYTLLWNEKNTSINIKGSAFFDQWKFYYPVELVSMGLTGGEGHGRDFNINQYTITGNNNYTPNIESLAGKNRNSYAFGLGFSQILSKRLQGSLALDIILQDGQLSTPFQRVYFSDVDNSYIEDFHLADDIERLPSSRIKTAIGVRLNYYLNEYVTLRSFYRFYKDDWDLDSHTASLEVPVKLWLGQITLYPSYRYYSQSNTSHFAPYDAHLSTQEFYTSDYDLSEYHAHQYGFGISYNNLYGTKKWWELDFRSIDLKYYRYKRNSAFHSHLITLGIKFKVF